MIKLAIRITNHEKAFHIGGDLEVITHIVSVENRELEELLEPAKFETKDISIAREEKVEEGNIK